MLCFDQICEKNLTSLCHRGGRHCLKYKWREKDLFNGILGIFPPVLENFFIIRTHTPLPTFHQTPSPSPPKRHPPLARKILRPPTFFNLSTYGLVPKIHSQKRGWVKKIWPFCRELRWGSSDGPSPHILSTSRVTHKNGVQVKNLALLQGAAVREISMYICAVKSVPPSE